MSQRSSHTSRKLSGPSRTSRHTSKTCQTVRLPQRTARQKNNSKLKHKMTVMNKHQAVTKCMIHWAVSAGFKVVTLNKISSGLTGKCFEIGKRHHTRNRYVAY